MWDVGVRHEDSPGKCSVAQAAGRAGIARESDVQPNDSAEAATGPEVGQTTGRKPDMDTDQIRAVARLPNVTIEIVHRPLPDGSGERISIDLQAVPSFAAFRQAVETTNPFALWMQATQLAFLPWINAASAMLPWMAPARLAGPDRPTGKTDDRTT
ncbi:hypothetical protein A33M_4305 [Rhodovulum sp. PH10]|nr:hypothetical protein A33M_4305 [Rhodovulum sp. PH10]